MDFSMRGAGGSGDEQGNNRNTNKGKSSYSYILTSNHKAQLEAIFELCPYPDEKQREQLAKELGVEPKQVKFWFQNRRTSQTKIAIQIENERMQCENCFLRERLHCVLCPSCGGPPIGEKEREHTMQKLLQHEHISNLLASYMEIQMSQPESQAPTLESVQCVLNREYDINDLDQDFDSSLSTLNDDVTPNPTSGSEEYVDMEKARMLEVATAAMEELVRLMSMDEPLWDRSSDDGRFVLVRETYEIMFPRANNFRSPNTREESSKYSQIVNIGGMQLVEMFLDSNKWVTLFPTIVSKAETTKVLDAGLMENRSGALQLMYEEMHVLSPLIPSREFFFLRYCKQVGVCAWVIANVSVDSFEEGRVPLCPSWRLPSGCMIRETMDGSSLVTWVEHVEVNDRNQTNWLYRDVVCNNIAYGAERWLMALKRMCEKIACFSIEYIPGQEAEGVITSREGRRSLLNLSHRMVQIFCEVLHTSGKPRFSEANNNELEISIRINTAPGMPDGIIVSTIGSIWLPLPPQHVFDLFRDENRRHKWDVLACRNPVREVSHIPIGTHAGNRISFIKPFAPTETNVLIFQESSIDSLGSYVVYAPVDVPNMEEIARGRDSSRLPILPSGFMITGDGRTVAEASSSGIDGRSGGGAILTVAFQILVCSGATIRDLRMETLASVHTLYSSTVKNIKAALNCSDLN